MMKFLKLCLAILIAFGNVSLAYGAEENVVSVNSTSGRPGSSVTVHVTLAGSLAYAAGSMDIVYDAAKLEVKDVTAGKAIEGAFNAINTVYKADTIKVAWISTVQLDEGNLFDIVFNIKETASGAADIALSNVEIVDTNGQSVSVKLNNGTVTINRSSGPSTDGPSDTGTESDSTPTPVPTSTTTPAGPTSTPKPIPQDIGEVAWAQSYILDVIDRGIMKGYVEADGSISFKPGGTATRAEFATAMCNYLGFEQETGLSFADMQGHWAAGYAARMAKEGIMTGYSAEEFAPDDAITREQIAVILYRAFKLKPGASEFRYTDHGNLSDWAVEGVYSVREAGWMTGDDAGTFRPQDTAIRAEIATIFSRLAQAGIK